LTFSCVKTGFKSFLCFLCCSPGHGGQCLLIAEREVIDTPSVESSPRPRIMVFALELTLHE
jgi:hypothetical protein